MEHSSRLFSVRSYALAFAVALSPAFFQTAYSCERGDTYLLMLNFGAPEGSSIPFNPNFRDYAVSTSADTVFMRVKTRDPGSIATYQWEVPGMPPDAGCIGVCGQPGGGDVTLTIPPGQSTLSVAVRSPENALGYYTIEVDHVPRFPCTEAGINAAIAVGTGPHVFDCDGTTPVLADNEIVINNSVWLDGEGKLTVDGMGAHRVFSVDQGITAWLTGMTVTGGIGVPEGGGILNQGRLTLSHSTVTANASAWGGGIHSSGGSLTLLESEVSQNVTDVAFCGPQNCFGGHDRGGGLYYKGTEEEGAGPLTVIRSTISGNVSYEGGGLWLFYEAIATFTDSTISGNETPLWDGAGIFSNGPVTLTNSTISGNAAGAVSNDGFGGGIFHTFGELTLVHTTLSGNTSTRGGGAIMHGAQSSITVKNSIIDGDCWAGEPVSSLGYNIESPDNTCGLTDVTDQVNVTTMDLALSPLRDNGGPTLTHAAIEGSAAEMSIPLEHCVDLDGAPVMADQRGAVRLYWPACTAGATGGLILTPFPCTEQGIRDAIASSDSRVVFACDGPTTVTTTSEIVIDRYIQLDGRGDLTIQSDGTHRVFYRSPEALNPSLWRMTVTGGGGVEKGGGIYNDGPDTLWLIDVTVAGNSADLGGGIFNELGADLRLIASRVSGNTANSGGGIYNYSYQSTVQLHRSTVSGNTAVSHGGGIFNLSGIVSLKNSTVSGNSADWGGGIASIDLFAGGSVELQMDHVTLSNNTATTGPSALLYNGAVDVWLSIIDGECERSPIDGPRPTGRWNVESPGATCDLTHDVNMLNVSTTALNLTSLQDNGGLSWTHMPVPPSAAIGRGYDCPTHDTYGGWYARIDQLGEPRVPLTLCEAGSVEVGQDGGVECDNDADCPPWPYQCRIASCEQNACDFVDVEEGTLCNHQYPWGENNPEDGYCSEVGCEGWY